jgi:beta-phosphoglucomutase-like phosphatase (HAD superfamily)
MLRSVFFISALLTSCLYAEKDKQVLGIIFDCDGTLVDTEELHFLSWQEAFAKEGISLTKEQYYPFSGHSGMYVVKKIYDQANDTLAMKIYADKKNIYKKLCQKKVPSIERTVTLVRELGRRKDELRIKLAVASAAPKKEILMHLKNLNILPLFDAVVSGSEDINHYFIDSEGVNKPKPYIYLYTVKLLGLEASQCIAFEDSYAGVTSATTAGLITFAVPNRYTEQQDFSQAIDIIDPSIEISVEELLQKIDQFLLKKEFSLKEDLISFER